MKNKRVPALAAALMLAVTWLNSGFEGCSGLSAADYLPVLAITGVIFLLKTGVLSALLLLLKKLWDHLRK